MNCDCENCQCETVTETDRDMVYNEMYCETDYQEVEFESEDYRRGVGDASYWSGFFDCLRTAGLSSDQAAGFMLRKMELDLDIKVAGMNKELSEFLAKKGYLKEQRENI